MIATFASIINTIMFIVKNLTVALIIFVIGGTFLAVKDGATAVEVYENPTEIIVNSWKDSLSSVTDGK